MVVILVSEFMQISKLKRRIKLLFGPGLLKRTKRQACPHRAAIGACLFKVLLRNRARPSPIHVLAVASDAVELPTLGSQGCHASQVYSPGNKSVRNLNFAPLSVIDRVWLTAGID
ncbi:hypothetical protein D3C85_1388060 [compost metagenome]